MFFILRPLILLSPPQPCLWGKCPSAVTSCPTVLGCGLRCPLPCPPVTVLPETPLNPFLTEGTSPFFFISVISSFKAIFLEAPEEKEIKTCTFTVILYMCCRSEHFTVILNHPFCFLPVWKMWSFGISTGHFKLNMPKAELFQPLC